MSLFNVLADTFTFSLFELPGQLDTALFDMFLLFLFERVPDLCLCSCSYCKVDPGRLWQLFIRSKDFNLVLRF